MQNDGIANTITNRASTVGANIVGVNFEVSVIIFGVGSEAKTNCGYYTIQNQQSFTLW